MTGTSDNAKGRGFRDCLVSALFLCILSENGLCLEVELPFSLGVPVRGFDVDFCSGIFILLSLSRIKHVADFVQFQGFFSLEFPVKALLQLFAVLVEHFYIPRTLRKMTLRRIQLL